MEIRNLSLLVAFIIYSLLIPFIASISFDSTTFSFTSFDPNSHDIRYEGDASTSDQVIQVTKNQNDNNLNDSVGRATYKEAMHLWDKVSGNLADFTTNFSFVVAWKNNSARGDGFTFFLAPNGSELINGSGGGSLGLLSEVQVSNSFDPSFVAVEFDTYTNGYLLDPKNDHVGIDINSLRSNKTVTWYTDTANGKKLKAWISYVSSSKNLSVVLMNGDDMRNSSSLYLIVDLRDYLPEWVTFGFSGATGSASEIHKIFSWYFSSSLKVAEHTNQTSNSGKSSNSGKWPWVVLGVSGGMLGLVSLVLGLVWFCCWMKRNRTKGGQDAATRVDEDVEMVTGPRKFSYEELVVATNKFADEGLLGEGGFGRVYKGFLRDMNVNVAVKRITPESQQGMKEYASEVKTISRLRHRNLVQLIGWCREKEEFLIVYEFVPNKSLDFHLFKGTCPLTWDKRYRIALGLASALFYLQEDSCEQCVLHRDIKSSNVLVDLNFNAKLGDFGLARIVDHGQGSRTTVLLGTEGYVAPEYLESSKPSKASDVYSFGIVALEIACGKHAIGEVERNGKTLKLLEWVWEQYGSANIFDAADPRLCKDYDAEQMKRLLVVGLACAHPVDGNRPSIREAVDMLNFKAPLPLLPLEMPVPTHVLSHQAHLQAISGSSSHSGSGSQRGQPSYSGSHSNTNSSKIPTSSVSSDTAQTLEHTKC